MGYGDDYREQQHTAFLNRWVPRTTEVRAENARWYLARALAAEDELHKIKAALAVLR